MKEIRGDIGQKRRNTSRHLKQYNCGIDDGLSKFGTFVHICFCDGGGGGVEGNTRICCWRFYIPSSMITVHLKRKIRNTTLVRFILLSLLG